jgi:hypothetical protein
MEDSRVYNALLKYAIDKEYQEGLTENEIQFLSPKLLDDRLGKKDETYITSFTLLICKYVSTKQVRLSFHY